MIKRDESAAIAPVAVAWVSGHKRSLPGDQEQRPWVWLTGGHAPESGLGRALAHPTRHVAAACSGRGVGVWPSLQLANVPGVGSQIFGEITSAERETIGAWW